MVNLLKSLIIQMFKSFKFRKSVDVYQQENGRKAVRIHKDAQVKGKPCSVCGGNCGQCSFGG